LRTLNKSLENVALEQRASQLKRSSFLSRKVLTYQLHTYKKFNFQGSAIALDRKLVEILEVLKRTVYKASFHQGSDKPWSRAGITSSIKFQDDI